MKIKIYTTIAMLGVLLGVTSCEKFLNEKNSVTLTSTTIFETQAGLESAMVGCYAGMVNMGLWQGRMCDYLGSASLLVNWQGNRLGDVAYLQCLDLCYWSTDTDNNFLTFTQTYDVINRANNILVALSDSPVDEAFKLEIEAEARLIRGIMYFLAVRMWGDVPLLTSPPATYENAHMARTSYLEVYKHIIDDLSFAEQNMRDPARQIEATGSTGRPNKWAASAFKAKVLVQIASLWSYPETPENNPYSSMPDFTNCGMTGPSDAWMKALETCETIITHGPYRLADSFRQLFNWGYDPDAPNQFSTSQAAIDYYLPERIFTLNVTENGTAATLYPENRSVPRLMDWLANNSANGRFRASRFVFQKFAQTYGATKYTPENDGVPTEWNLWKGDCKDPRFDISFFHTQLYMRKSANTSFNAISGPDINIKKIYPSVAQKDIDSRAAGTNIVIGTTNDTHAPFFRKYHEPRYNNTQRGYADYYLLRYADIYLMAAEAAAELSNGPGDANWIKAMGYIEDIHRRARFSTTDGIEAPQPRWESNRFLDKQELLDAIFWERIYEFTGEGHEWFDERRKGMEFFIRNVTKPFNAFLNQVEQASGGNSGYRSRMYGNRNMPETPEQMRAGMLCGFPQQEIELNNNIGPEDQNRFIIQ
jgi:hypothetical protein